MLRPISQRQYQKQIIDWNNSPDKVKITLDEISGVDSSNQEDLIVDPKITIGEFKCFLLRHFEGKMFFLKFCMDNSQSLREYLDRAGKNIVKVYTDLKVFPMKVVDTKQNVQDAILPQVQLSDPIEKIAQQIKDINDISFSDLFIQLVPGNATSEISFDQPG